MAAAAAAAVTAQPPPLLLRPLWLLPLLLQRLRGMRTL
jgi:hypothetical protein